MKVAMITPPIGGHEKRGIGVYTSRLAEALEKYTETQVVYETISNLPKDVDLYHFPYFDPFFLTLPLFRSKPTVITIHDLIPIRFSEHFPSGLRGHIKWQIQKRMAGTVNAIITDSFISKEDIKTYMNINESVIHVVHLAPAEAYFKKVDTSTKSIILKKHSIPEKFVLYVGDMNWNKNLPRLIDVCIQIDVPLVIVSSALEKEKINNPWQKDMYKVEEQIKRHKNIQCINSCSAEELAALYQSAQMLVVPSYYEGFGLPMVEAFASECPVIAGDGGSLKEIAGGAAAMFNPSETDSLSEEIKKMFENQLRRNIFVRKGNIRIMDFSWEKTAIETTKVYNICLHL